MNEDPDLTSPHTLPDLYATAMILLCDTCGCWEIVGDVWEEQYGNWRSKREVPYACVLCKAFGQEGTVSVVQDDEMLQRIPERDDVEGTLTTPITDEGHLLK